MLDTGLRQRGFGVWLAANGPQAIQVYRQHSPDIDLVVLDVRMPGLDGLQTLSALEEVDSRVRCCFMSGDTGTYTRRELLRPSVVHVLTKPFRLAELEEIVARQATRNEVDAG
jgi:CheY-like chemotaxis protein